MDRGESTLGPPVWRLGCSPSRCLPGDTLRPFCHASAHGDPSRWWLEQGRDPKFKAGLVDVVKKSGPITHIGSNQDSGPPEPEPGDLDAHAAVNHLGVRPVPTEHAGATPDPPAQGPHPIHDQALATGQR